MCQAFENFVAIRRPSTAPASSFTAKWDRARSAVAARHYPHSGHITPLAFVVAWSLRAR